MNKIKNYKKIVVITLSFLLMFTLVIPSAQNNVFAEGRDEQVEEKIEDSENIDNNKEEQEKEEKNKEENESNVEDEEKEQTKETEDSTLEDIEEEIKDDIVEEEGENITNEITKPSQSSGEHSNRSSGARAAVVGVPSLAAVNAEPPLAEDIYFDVATGLRYSRIVAPGSNSHGAILERPDPSELVLNRWGDFEIPKVVAGIPLVGIRKGAFRNLGLPDRVSFLPESAAPLPDLYIGDYAFAENEIKTLDGRTVSQILGTGRAGIGIFMNNQITNISNFFIADSIEVPEYRIPSLTFANNKIKNANLASRNVIKHIGVMAFANNQMETVSSGEGGLIGNAFREGVTIYSGAFYNNKITTDAINALPDNIVFSTSTTDIFGGNSKTLNADGSKYSSGYADGLGAFQKNLLTEVPTVKAGWKLGYRTFADNLITSIIVDDALLIASENTEGCFANNPLTEFKLNFTYYQTRSIPKEFIAVKNYKGEYFRDTRTSESLRNVRLELPSMLINDHGTLTIGIGAFRGTNISEIKDLSAVGMIGNEAFALCENLTSIHADTYGGALAYTHTIGQKAFYQCYNLEGQLMLPNHIKIGQLAFSTSNNFGSNVPDPNAIKGKLTSLQLVDVGHSNSVFDVGRGAFAYQSLQGSLNLSATGGTNGGVTGLINIGAFAFAFNELRSVYIPGVDDFMPAGTTVNMQTKCFVGNQFTHYNPGIHGTGTIALDAFSSQNITGLTVKQDLTQTHSLSLAGYANLNSGTGPFDLNKMSSASIFGGNAPMTGGSASVEGGNPLYIKWGSAKPTQVIMRYLIKNINGNVYNGAVVDTKFNDLKYEYEIKYQIGNLNNDQAGFSPDMTEKFVQKYVKEDSGLIASATEGSTIHLNPEYTIIGWYDNPDCVGTPISNTANPTEATTIYAKIVKPGDLTFHSGANAEFGSVGSGVREKVLRVQVGSTVRETFAAMSEEERNQWNVAFDTTSSDNVDMKRVGEWFTTPTFAGAYYDGSPITNAYDMDAPVTDATPKNLYADVAKFKEITFHSVAPPDVSGDNNYVYYSGAFESENSGIVSKTMTVRYGEILKNIFESMPESERPKWEIKYDTSEYDRLYIDRSPWLFSDGLTTGYYVVLSANTPTELYPMILKRKGSIKMYSGAFAEFGTIGSGIRELEYKVYEGMEGATITTILMANVNLNPSLAPLFNPVYDIEKYDFDTNFYANPQLTEVVNREVPYTETYGYSDIYIRLTPRSMEDIIPDPDNPDTPLWGVEVPRKVLLEIDLDVSVKTKLVSLTGYDEAFGTDLHVNLYIRSENGMKLKRVNSTEELKYRVILGAASLGGTSLNQGTTDTLAGTFTSTNKTIQGSARVLEDSELMSIYKDNLVFKIQTQIMP